MNKIGFIGIGVMGSSMVSNLMKHGYDVSVYTRTKEKANNVLNEGAHWCDSVKECVKDKDYVITIVGYPKDVEEVYFGENGIIENAKEGCILIDMTTTSPSLSIRIYEEAKKHHLYALDAPVSGGDIGARQGTLAIMVGGDKDIFEKAHPVFEAMGKNIIYEGKAGNGQHCKMANQIALAGALASTCEAITYANKVGLDVKTMLDTICNGAAGSWQLSNNGYKILEENYEPGFYIAHFMKDMRIAKEEMKRQDTSLPVLDEVYKLYEELEEPTLGTQALIKQYRK